MFNQVQLIGNLGRDPETRYTTGGDAVTNLNIATTERWKDKQGEKQERTEWHRVVMFGKLAEIAGEYLKKGAMVFIQGKLQTREWEKDGVKRYTTEVVANEMKMLGGKREEGDSARASAGSGQDYKDAKDGKTSSARRGAGGDFDDDIPF